MRKTDARQQCSARQGRPPALTSRTDCWLRPARCPPAAERPRVTAGDRGFCFFLQMRWVLWGPVADTSLEMSHSSHQLGVHVFIRVHMYVYVSICMYMCASICACTHMFRHWRMHMRVHYRCPHTRTCTHVCVYIHIHICTRLYICTRTCVQCLHMYVYTRVHVCTCGGVCMCVHEACTVLGQDRTQRSRSVFFPFFILLF